MISSISVWLRATRGSMAGMIAVQSAGMALAGTATWLLSPPTAAARPAGVGVLNKARTSAGRPAWRMRSITVTASSEWPPSSKKWSWRPTRSSLSTSAQIRARVSSTAPTGGA
jgi:hypothetical protein